jgi:lipopolysaccharide biosynthesis glycosyltransferase
MIAFFTALNNNFMPGMKALLKSLLVNNPWFNHDFIILIDEDISFENKKELLKLYKNIKFINAKIKDYKNCKKTSVNWNFNLFYRFDVFELQDLNYDKIVMIDSDMIILKDIKELLEYDNDISVCKKYPNFMPELKDIKGNFFNCGLILLSRNIINLNHKKNLLEIASQKNWSSDQPILNFYFRDKITFIPQKFNVVTSNVTLKNLNEISILHFHGNKKPWMSDNIVECFEPFVNNLITRAGEDSNEILTRIKKLYEYYR